MRSLVLTALAALGLGGCAGAMIKERMTPYTGQPVSALFAKLGYPTAEQTLAGNKVYIWANTRFVEGTSYQCKIRAIVDSREIITSWDYEGNEGGCSQYAYRL
jgi:hypothetical protein